MSVNVEYPSEYFKESITAKGAITAKVDFTADPDTGLTPLHHLISNNNQVEIKRIAASNPAEVAEVVKENDILHLCESVTVFKVLHNCYHNANKDYDLSHFEDAIAAISGTSLSCYAHRVKADDKVDQTVKKQLTTRGLRNFLNSVSWTPGKSLRQEKLTPGVETLVYMTDFISKYYDKEDFFAIDEEDGSTPLHELIEGDNLGPFLYAVKAFDLENLGKCVDGNGNTLLNWAFQHGYKKVAEYLITTEGLPINDKHNDDGVNSAGSLVKCFDAKQLRGQYYVNMIDESKLKDPKLSYLNHARGTKYDLSEVTHMSDKLLDSGTGTKGESYRSIIEANAAAIKVAEEKARAALEKAKAAVKA